MSAVYFGMPLESAAISSCLDPIEMYNNLSKRGFLRYAVCYALARAKGDVYTALHQYALTPSDKQFMAIKFLMTSRYKAVEDPSAQELAIERNKITSAIAASRLADKLSNMDPEAIKNILQIARKNKT